MWLDKGNKNYLEKCRKMSSRLFVNLFPLSMAAHKKNSKVGKHSSIDSQSFHSAQTLKFTCELYTATPSNPQTIFSLMCLSGYHSVPHHYKIPQVFFSSKLAAGRKASHMIQSATAEKRKWEKKWSRKRRNYGFSFLPTWASFSSFGPSASNSSGCARGISKLIDNHSDFNLKRKLCALKSTAVVLKAHWMLAFQTRRILSSIFTKCKKVESLLEIFLKEWSCEDADK